MASFAADHLLIWLELQTLASSMSLKILIQKKREKGTTAKFPPLIEFFLNQNQSAEKNLNLFFCILKIYHKYNCSFFGSFFASF